MTLTIREAGEADAPALLALIAQPDYGGRAVSEAEGRAILRRMAAYPFYRAYLARDGNEVAGMICLLVLDNLGHMGDPVALVENVIVATDRQGSGVGRLLMAEAGRIAAEAGAYKLILATGLKRTGAHAFYERLGFRRYGVSFGLPLVAETRNSLAGDDTPLLSVRELSKRFGAWVGCADVSFDLWPGEVLAVVGESGSGKTTLLNCVSTLLPPDVGRILYRMRDGTARDVFGLGEAERRLLMRTDWGFVRQNPAEGLRMTVSAGANVGERLMAVGERNYARLRGTASDWLARVEIDTARIDDQPRTFSGGMRQRLQIARNLVTHPRLVFMDEPTGGLDVSVQARLLDTLRALQRDLGMAAIVVTHDLGVARLLSSRMMVMKGGRVIEEGLTDRVLDDPREPYTQLLVSSILPP